ncbi:ABC transporter ATP-binding protein [Oleidesulfovibrio alaskensis]
MIRLRNATLGHGTTPVLHNISLHIRQGEMTGLLGPNGSGKTTLLLTLSGVLPPVSGEVLLRTASAASEKDAVQFTPAAGLCARTRAKKMASVPQRPDSVPDMPVRSVVLMGRYPYISFLGGYSAADNEAAENAMRQTATSQFASRPACRLSGGEFQRVLIARALAQAAPCLLLDEATSGLDIARKVEIYDMLRRRHAQGLTVVAAIHDLNLAALYCDRLIFLKDGAVALDGPTRDVFTEANLCRIYETSVRVFRHPDCGLPQALFMPARTQRKTP